MLTCIVAVSCPHSLTLPPKSAPQVLERIKDPLMTLVSRDHHETAYAVLAHFLTIAQRAPLIFASVRALDRLSLASLALALR